MPIDIIDGFDQYPGVSTAGVGLTANWISTGAGVITLPTGRVGGQCVQLAGSASARLLTRLLSAMDDEFAGFFAMYYDPNGSALTNKYPIFRLEGGSAVHLSIGYGVFGELVVFGPAGTQIAEIGGALQPLTWYSIAFSGVIHDTLGWIKVWVNGELKVNLANTDTKNAGAAGVDRISLRAPNASGAGVPVTSFDDVRFDIGTTAQIKEGRSVPILPVSDSSTQFTPSAGADNYAMVDETLCDSDTTYNTSNTVGHEDKFGFGDLPFNPDEIFAVQISIAARKDDVATRRLQAFIESNAVREDAPDFYLGTDYTWRHTIIESDPDGNIPWTKSSVDALQGGYTIIE